MTSSPVDVSKLEAALEKATPGEWRQMLGDICVVVGNRSRQVAVGPRGSVLDAADAELIVAAVNHLPAFVALVRAVEALADEWTADADGDERWLNGSRVSVSEAQQLPSEIRMARDHVRALRAAVGAALNPQETGR